MTSTPPPAAPAPAPAPAKTPSSGTVPLVFGIVFLFIAMFPAIGALSRLLLAALRADAFIFGQAIGFLIFTAIFLIPGLLLIRRSNRARRANRAATDAEIYRLEHAYDEDDIDTDIEPPAAKSPTAPPVAPPAAPPVPPIAPPT
jgi:hypothetical protein